MADCGQRFALPHNTTRADNNKKMTWKWEKKKAHPAGAVEEPSTFARYAFKGFRFAPIPCGDGYAALERTRCAAMP